MNLRFEIKQKKQDLYCTCVTQVIDSSAAQKQTQKNNDQMFYFFNKST